MPNKPISIEFTSDTDKYERGLKDAARATDKLGDEIEGLEDSSSKAARGIDKDMGKVQDSMADAGKESAQEFKQNLGESLASGDISTILQDTAGGLVSGLSGPLSIAAAALAGVAALAFSRLQDQAAQAAQLSATYLDLMRERLGMIQGEINKAFDTQQMQSFVQDNLDFFQGINDELIDAGINANDYASAVFHGGQELADMEAQLRANRDLHKEIVTEGGRTKVVYDDAGDALGELISGLGTLKDAQIDANEEARTYDAIFGHSANTIKNLKNDLATIANAKPVTIEVQQKTIQAYGTATPYGVGGGYSTYKNKPGASG